MDSVLLEHVPTALAADSGRSSRAKSSSTGAAARFGPASMAGADRGVC